MFMFLSIYLIVGIVYLSPFLMYGASELADMIERLEANWKTRLQLGFGALINVLIWPILMVKAIYKLYIR